MEMTRVRIHMVSGKFLSEQSTADLHLWNTNNPGINGWSMKPPSFLQLTRSSWNVWSYFKYRCW